MIKVIGTDSFDHDGPAASLMDVHSRGVDGAWMTKRAALFSREIKEIKPEPGYSYIHLISLGAGEFSGANRNGDWFNEKSGSFELPCPKDGQEKHVKLAGGLSEFHPTFMKGHVFKHHANSDPKRAIGEIKAAAYNKDMHRGELIIKVPHGKEWDADLQKLASGSGVSFSMACKEPHDRCSLCGNVAPSRSFYCGHLKNHMTELTKEGHQVFAINDVYNFFDISKVFKPADRIAWGLAKVASAVQGGAALAEFYGLVEALATAPHISKHAAAKRAIAKKLADIEKTIELRPDSMLSIAGSCPVGDLSADAGQVMKKHPLSNVMSALGEAKIAMPLKAFAQLIMGDGYADAAIPTTLPGLFSKMSAADLDEVVNCETYDITHEPPVTELRSLVGSLKAAHSLDAEPVRQRLTLSIIRGAQPVLVKSGSVDPVALPLVREYAKYLLSFVKTSGTEESVPLLTVLHNYRKV